ncbi:hypothetical protein N0V90_008408 [Kalmusia sp. IMI 367209]|nr:hypothetical protein N0V90_008408 [Kalmusia sp. IMI 367209]
MSFAMVLCIAGACIVIPEVYYGAGKHIDQIEDKNFQTAFKLNFVTQPIYLIAICVVKLSVGFFLLRIAIVPLYRRIIQGIMIFMAFYTTACFFTVMFQCTNLAVQWDPSVEGTCWPSNVLKGLSYANVACNITTDLLFAIVIPIPMLWQIQLNRRQKSSLICILGLGVFATAAAIVKISYLPNYGRTGDWLWDSRNITIWTVLESCVGVIAGNLPCLKPLFRSVLGSTYGRGSRGRSGTTPRYSSRAYGAGTIANCKSTKASGWNSLGSSKAGREPVYSPEPYGLYESHLMTSIAANKGNARSASASSMREDGRSEKSSHESVKLLDTQGRGASLKLGGIMKTTEVTSTETRVSPTLRGTEEGLRPEREIEALV